MQGKSVITRTIEAAGGVYAPGHLGELTQIVDFVLVDTVIEETGSREKRLRLLPSRVVVYFVLALALFEDCSYRGVRGRLTAGLEGLPLVRPAVSSLSRARRRIGAAPLRRLFEILAGPVAHLGQAGSFYRGLRTVAVDGTASRPAPARTPPASTGRPAHPGGVRVRAAAVGPAGRPPTGALPTSS
ncbi:transposase domain-containing protein [Streptomyces scopuliridis]|uniref:transposase domain-containing protein n=1 Tax=Streptomyces scopuliridis TaxID=452529 RepID=UPI002DDBCBE2|nr:transposase domain-containing protein [Streptomyces scopuliridis]WSB33321.1 transposase domain-containing protein [Streptomyces scopuliridis]